jgi:hypothetical protein
MRRNMIDPRRLPEIQDSELIRVDNKAMANCPTQAIHHEWAFGKGMPWYLFPDEDNGISRK